MSSDLLTFQEFPLKGSDETRHLVKDIRAICNHVAQKNRGDGFKPELVVQHSDAELAALYEIAGREHDEAVVGGSVLQCGIFCGGSAIAMALAQRDSDNAVEPIVAIDSYTKDYAPLRELFSNAYHEFRENLWEFRLQDYIVAVMADTGAFLEHFWRQPTRVAFIDASHHYESTHKELSCILPHLVDGGWLVLHDYFNEETPGVAQALDEAMEEMKHYTCYRQDELVILRLAVTDGIKETPTEVQLHWVPRAKG